MEIARMGRKMDKENLFTQMDNIKMEFGKTMNLSQEKSILHMRMVISIKAGGSMEILKERVILHKSMLVYTKVSLKKGFDKVLVQLSTSMVNFTKEIGWVISMREEAV